jgi:hypothetical protein
MLVPHPWSRVATEAADSGSVRAAIGGLKLQDPSLQQPRQWTKEWLLAVLAYTTISPCTVSTMSHMCAAHKTHPLTMLQSSSSSPIPHFACLHLSQETQIPNWFFLGLLLKTKLLLLLLLHFQTNKLLQQLLHSHCLHQLGCDKAFHQEVAAGSLIN